MGQFPDLFFSIAIQEKIQGNLAVFCRAAPEHFQSNSKTIAKQFQTIFQNIIRTTGREGGGGGGANYRANSG